MADNCILPLPAVGPIFAGSAPYGAMMSRIASIWTGLIKAGALALVLALFGFATASAHDAHAHHQAAQAAVTTAHHHADPAPAVMAAAAVDCHQQASAPADDADRHGHHGHDGGTGDDCCQDACACGCAVTCTAHMHTGLSDAVAVARPMPAALLVPGGAIDPAGLTTPPDPRPPLSI